MASTTQTITATVDIGNGVELYYEERGTGIPLLFVHGMWGSCRFFHKQLAALSSNYRVIALDLRGHGRSSMTMSGQTVPTYARDVAAFVEKLKLREFVAVGWSMGAFVWWDYHRQFGTGGVRALVVIDQPPSDWQSPEIPNALLTLDALRSWHYRIQTERNALMQEVIPMMFAKPPERADFQWMHDEMTRAPEVIAAAVLFDQSTRDYRQALEGYPVPTLVCGGGRSAQPRAGLELIVESVDDGRLTVFEQCGHCLFLEDAERFNTEVRDFVRAQLPDGVGC
jgi:pimeloyl-ACP methyl ester carboxylesterase